MVSFYCAKLQCRWKATRLKKNLWYIKSTDSTIIMVCGNDLGSQQEEPQLPSY